MDEILTCYSKQNTLPIYYQQNTKVVSRFEKVNSQIPLSDLSSYLIVFFIVFFMYKTFLLGTITNGLLLSVFIVFLVSSVQLFYLILMKQFLSEAYLKIKKRPIHIVNEIYKDKEQDDEKKQN